MKSWPVFSAPGRNRRLIWTALCALCAGCAALSLCLGAAPVSLGDTLRALLGRGEGTPASIVLYARLPRTCGCLLAGMALAVSGAVIQSVLGNPMAAPNIIGVNAGAGLAVALLGAAAPAAAAASLSAFLGALAGVFLVLLIAERTGASRLTLILSGMAVSSIFSAGIDAVVTLAPDALLGYSDFRIGSLKGLTIARLTPAFWIILPAFALVLSLAGALDVLMLGRDVARSLGLRVKPLRQADAANLAERTMEELSGGQRQKVYLAMALAQDTPAILMDEPTTFLDVGHQLAVMETARRLAGEGKAVLMALHDLCLALRWADELAVLDAGGLACQGSAEEVFQSGLLDRVFGVAVRRVETPGGWQYYYDDTKA